MVTTPIKDKNGEASSGYFLHNIQPNRISSPSDSIGESKNYDPDIYPEKTSLDIRKDEGDEDHMKFFVSFSADKGKKEKKSRDQSISFRNVYLRKENMRESHIELIFKHSDVYIVKVLK